MNEILAVALVCAAGVAGPDCGRGNALDVVVAPVRSQIECLMTGQVLATGLNVGENGDGSYVKVSCERRRMASAEAGAR